MTTTIQDYRRSLYQRQNKWDIRFLQMARLVSSWSKDPSTQTGAVITDSDNRLISTGFNGFPQSMLDRDDWYQNRDEKYSRIVHCEVNAMLFAGRRLDRCTLYTWPFASCDRCVVQMLQAGISRFVFPSPTEDALSRWGAAFEKTKTYVMECGATYEQLARTGDLA